MLLCSLQTDAATRYWVGAFDNDWNEVQNWSTGSGGAGGASVPGSADIAIFNSAGNINCNLDIAPTLESMQVLAGFTATIDLNGNALSISGTNNSTFADGNITNSSGSFVFTIGTTGQAIFSGSTFSVELDVDAGRIFLNGSTFNNKADFNKTGGGNDASTGGNVFNDSTYLVNSGTAYFLIGNVNPDTFNALLTLIDTSTSYVAVAHNSSGNYFAEDIILNSTGAGIRFGVGGSGNSILAATKTVTIGSLGFSGTDLYFVDFTQSGATNQNLSLSGTARLFLDRSDWGGDFTASAPRIYLDENRFRGTCSLTKTGASNDDSAGGNVFDGETRLINSGSARFLNGNVLPDTFQTNLTTTISGSNYLYIGNTAAGNYIGGNLTVNNTGSTTGSSFYLSNNLSSSTTIAGNVSVNNTGSGTDMYSYLGNTGDLTILGNLALTNSGGTNVCYFYAANNDGSLVTIDGLVTLNNSSSASNASIYLGNNGDVTLDSNLILDNTNTSAAATIIVGSGATSDVTITGNVVADNTGSGTINRTYIGNNGNVTITGTLDIDNSGSGATEEVYVASGTTSTVSIGGNTTVQNAGTGATTSRAYLGNYGDITFDGTLRIRNSSAATNSQTYLSYRANSDLILNDSVFVESTNALNDGILFGNQGGFTTLANTKTISLSSGGYIAGALYLRNINQIGTGGLNLPLTGTSYLYLIDDTLGGNVDCSAPRIYLEQTRFGGTVDLEKTGATDDFGYGGNYFTGVTDFNNSGSGYFRTGRYEADTFVTDLSITNTGTNNVIVAYDSVGHYIGGDLVINNSGTYVSLSNQADASLHIEGTVDITNTGSGAGSAIFFANSGDVVVDGDLTYSSTATALGGDSYFSNGATASLTLNGTASFTHANPVAGAGNHRLYLGRYGDVTFNDSLWVLNSCEGNNSQVYIGEQVGSAVSFAEHIVLENSSAFSDGIFFGTSGGSSVLAASKTVNIGAAGFSAGQLYFRNFTQTGGTAQSLTLTGTGYLLNYDATWGGNVTFVAPRIYNSSSRFLGTSTMTKNGAGSDDWYGGNYFMGDLSLTNSSDFYVRSARTQADSAIGNVTLSNTGLNGLIWAYTGPENYIGGNLTATNTSGYLTFSDVAGSSLQIDGDVNITSNGVGLPTTVTFGNAGSITVDGNFAMTTTTSDTTSTITASNGASSIVTFNGTVDIINTPTNGTGQNQRAYFGNNGQIICNDSLRITNTSTADNSQVYVGTNASGNQFNEHIILESTGANCDGIYFHNSAGGSGTLAASKSIIIGPGGYTDGQLYFRNFTQAGTTAQSMTLTNLAVWQSYDCDWGGNLTAVAPQVYSRGSLYNGTSYLEKTGGVGNRSVGGNTFMLNSIWANSGSAEFSMGNGTGDSCLANLTLNNSSSSTLIHGYGTGTNYIAGNLEVNNTGTSGNSYAYVSSSANSTLFIGGNADLNNTGSSANGRIYFANAGDITLTGSLDVDNNGTAGSQEFYIANTSAAELTVNGATTLLNRGSGATVTSRIYFGNDGSITQNGTLDVINRSGVTNDRIYLNYDNPGVLTLNGNVTVEDTAAGSDGVSFGEAGGTSTLSAGNTLTVSANGFSAGDLRLQNFTQVGGTAQTLSLTGTARFYPYLSTFNGSLTVTAPWYYLRSNVFNGIFTIDQTGTVTSQSYGDNTYNNDVSITVSGSGQLRLADNLGNDYNGDVSFVQSAGTLQPCRDDTSRFAGDVNVNFSGNVTFAAGNGYVEFDGTGAQSFNDLGTSSNVVFRRLNMNKPSGILSLNEPVIVTTTGVFTAGVMNTTNTNILRFNDNSTSAGGNDSSFVDGPVLKVGNGAATFNFPVGDSIYYGPIGMSAPGNAAQFQAQYYHVSPRVAVDSNYEASIQWISTEEYWTLDRLNGSDNETVTLNWNLNSGGVTSLADLTVCRYDNVGGIWRDEGNGGTTGSTSAGSVVSLAAITSFSPFTLGTTNVLQNPLPISLLSFDVLYLPTEESVELKWSTASEKNADVFILERSDDGIAFETFEEHPASGNSNIKRDYIAYDKYPLSGLSYYRIRQVDFDGKEYLLPLRNVFIKDSRSLGSEMKVFPNPNDGEEVNISIEAKSEEGSMQIRNYLGQLVLEETLPAQRPDFLIKLNSLSTGVYQLSLEYPSQKFVEKLFID